MWDMHHDPVNMMILHHRQPTATDNKIAQTHPIEVDSGSLKHKYLVIHNGVIHNDDELKKEHEDLGFIYTTQDDDRFNDSECVAIEVGRFIEGQTEKVEIQGSCAFVALQINKKTNKAEKIFFGRNEDNPLHMAKTRGKMILSSEGPGDDVTPFKLYSCKLDAEMNLEKRKMPFKAKEITIIPAATVRSWQREFDQEKLGGRKYWDEYDDEPVYPDKEDSEEGIKQGIADMLEDCQGELDMFVEEISDPEMAMQMEENDIEFTLEGIRKQLFSMLQEAKEYHEKKTLKEEAKEPVVIGFEDQKTHD
jgi:uncharacterized protein YfkK (UPF0435 family)